MMQQWANLLDEWKRTDSNGVPLKEAAAWRNAAWQ